MKLIPLTQGKSAKVSEESFDFVNQWKWRYGGNGYAVREQKINGKPTNIYLHRLLTDAPKGLEVDHINSDKLDNQLSNLRLVTSAQNKMNTGLRSTNSSGCKGVYWHKAKGKWHARIRQNYKHIHLGYFDKLDAAAAAYVAKAQELYGEFARIA